MSAAAGSDSFVDALCRSELVTLERLASYRAADADPTVLAEWFVADGLITRFQADRLLQGKWRGFTVAGKYRLLEPIGAGGMGTVFLAEHLRMRSPVALKMLSADAVNGPADLRRLEREARAAAGLSHPNLVRAFDIDEADGLHYLVMEFVHGVGFQRLGEGAWLPVSRAVEYARQAALGLHHAHAAGLIHRDVKPGNLIVGANGTVRVLDLGLARFFHDRHDKLTDEQNRDSILGTADYLSPEQAIDSSGVDARADVYSLGATLYYLLAGRPPFAGGTTAEKLIWHQTRDPKPPAAVRPDVPPDLSAFVLRMMAKDPAGRPQTAAEVADELAAWVTEPVPPPAAAELPDFCPLVRKLLPAVVPPPSSAVIGRASGVALASTRRSGRYRSAALTAAGVLAAGAVAGWAAQAWLPSFEPPPPVSRDALPNPFGGVDPTRPLNADAAFGHTGERRTVRFFVKARERDPATRAIHLYSRSSAADLKNFTVVVGPAAEAALVEAGMRNPYDELNGVWVDATGGIAYLRNQPGRPSIEVTAPADIRVVPAAERGQ